MINFKSILINIPHAPLNLYHSFLLLSDVLYFMKIYQFLQKNKNTNQCIDFLCKTIIADKTYFLMILIFFYAFNLD
jgi:hypothetical protein